MEQMIGELAVGLISISVLNIGAFLYSYGRLSQKVDGLAKLIDIHLNGHRKDDD